MIWLQRNYSMYYALSLIKYLTSSIKMTTRDKRPAVKILIFRTSFIIFLAISLNSLSQTTGSGPYGTIADFLKVPQIRWEFKIGSPIFSSPAVSNDLVYFGGLDGILYAIDLSSGEEKWRFKTSGEIRSKPLIDGDRVFVNSGDGSLYMLDKKSGSVIWKFSTMGEHKYDFADYFNSTPVIFDRTLYFGSGDSNFYAIDSETGNLKWKYKTGDIIHNTAAIYNNKVFFGSFDGYVYALDLRDGELVWKFKTVGHRYFPKGEVQGSPAFFKDLIFIGARDYNVYAIDQEKGYCHWNKSFTKGWGLNNTIHDSLLYIGSADERVLVSADPESGRELWKKNMEFLVFGNCVFSKTMLYVGTTIGKLHGISLESGEKIWSFETGTYVEKRSRYFKPDDTYRDDIYSIIKSNEQFLDVECELGGIFSTPYIDNNNIIFSSTNGILYCLKR